MQIDIVTIFPGMFVPVLGESILKRAKKRGLLEINMHNLRDYTSDKRHTVDDRPYGGGPGMVMRPEPIFKAVESIKRGCLHKSARRCQTILMSPQGGLLSSALAEEISTLQHAIIICGHYEGVDERVRLALVDRCVSIGDYILTGGELPAMVLIDSVCRFIPAVLGHAKATSEESFKGGYLEYPQYTRPPIFRDMAVPEVLRCGNHKRIERWRKLQSVRRTLALRPDLIGNGATTRLGPRPITVGPRSGCRQPGIEGSKDDVVEPRALSVGLR